MWATIKLEGFFHQTEVPSEARKETKTIKKKAKETIGEKNHKKTKETLEIKESEKAKESEDNLTNIISDDYQTKINFKNPSGRKKARSKRKQIS